MELSEQIWQPRLPDPQREIFQPANLSSFNNLLRSYPEICDQEPSLSEVLSVINNPYFNSVVGGTDYDLYLSSPSNPFNGLRIIVEAKGLTVIEHESTTQIGDIYQRPRQQLNDIVTLAYNRGLTQVPPIIYYLVLVNRVNCHRLWGSNYKQVLVEVVVKQYQLRLRQVIRLASQHKDRKYLAMLVDGYIKHLAWNSQVIRELVKPYTGTYHIPIDQVAEVYMQVVPVNLRRLLGSL